MMDSESYRAAVEWGLPKSFTPFHGCLLDFLRNPRARPGIPSLENEGKILTSKDLDSLRIMVEIEFEASCQQELSGSETADTKPHVFDVFLMQTTFDQSSIRGSERKIAVCVPFQKQVQWWNGLPRNAGGAFWPLEPKSHIRKITSLSGTARVLQALSEAQSSPSDLTRWAMNRTSLFSVPTIDVDGEIIRSSTMNESQQRAVDAMSHFQSGFFCIQGPPGCGKTTTMVQMILAAKKQGGVLVAAPSNAAVANIALKLYATGLISFGEAVVFGTNCDESVHFLEPSYRSSQYTKFRNNYDVALSSPEGFEPTEKQKQKAQQLLEEFALWLHLDKDDLSLSNASSHCPNIPVDETGSVTFLGRKIMNQLLGDASVIFCTLNSVGSFSLSSALDRKNFKTLMIDEGGQCTEAEFFLATSFPGIQRILVMGDPKQLRPTVIDLDCARAGYGQSFLGQVFKGSPEKLHLLDTQYRMDPAIVAFPNRRFYNNQIQNGENVLQREPHVNKPFLFVDTNRYGREEKIQHSWQNQYEASAIAVLLRRDEDINRLLATSDETKVIIITPYKSQMRLLENQIKLPKGSKAQLMTSTVDAFQGQEGDIVIVSTVRTKFVGFVDDAQRLNVALTRAKRVLRVVGDKRFFESLGDHSTLRQLVEHAWNAGQWIVSPVKRVRFSPPDWSMPTLWKITMTQRFHHCLFHMKNMPSKNICLNTLFAIAIPDLRAIRGKKVAENSGWKINSLNGAEDLRVVWIAKKDVAEGRPIIEAHFAGDRQSCLRFIQTNHRSQAGSLIPKSDMSGLLPTKLDATAIADGTPMPSWKLDNDTQQAILSGTLSEMPFSFLELDPPQKLAARAPPPLLIESRSGTGKTLVLLQHAALTTRMDQSRPACFVTVSPKLKEELNKKYLELRPILFDGLRPTEFFSFRELLYSLLHLTGIDAFCDKSICTFDGYIGEKNSYQRCTIEPQEVENEIGGVIMGSLAAAIGNAALNRQEYLSNKRSNISNKSKEGVQKRHLVYDEYEKYTRWKVATSRYDLNDVILCLLNKKIDQLFSSAYLDEVQDLSHAAIYLICNLAGKDSRHWVCAGDPAQMISPGCSFTFDGLKQTLLCVAPGIERQLKQVHHLVVNYRTTKDILVVANSILDIAKQAFPGAIEYALPETAVKDLGLRVVTCDWQAAMQTSVRFGENQVFIYSPCDSDTLLEDANKWLNGHPFILSSLDSKGLEFDDVVVAFDIDRKLWDISRKVEASLRMLRELYVAVTRAQRRVVILVKKDNKNMKGFFESLNCEEINAATIFEEFDHETTKEQWFARGMSLYSGDHFKLAVGCFTRAEHHGWAFLANGKESLRIGLGSEAEDHFRRAARFFHEEQETEKILDILKQLVDMSSKWDAADDELFTAAFSTLPNYLPKRYKVNFHLKRGDWHMIRYSDLADPSLSELFAAFRDDEQLKGIVRKATDEERYQIENVLPWAHADYHIDRGNEFEALKIFIGHEEFIPAMQCSERLLNDGTGRKNPTLCQDIVELWTKRQPVAPRFTGSSNAKTALLLLLFTSPLQAASSSSEQCLKLFGGDVIRAAIKRANLDATTLLLFRDDGLKKEVISTLESRFVPYYTAVVEELVDTGHRGFADEYARHREWVNVDLLRLVLIFRERPKWFLQLLERKLLLGAATWLVLFNDKLTDGNKEQYRSNYKSCFCREITKPVELNPFASHFLSLWKREMFLELLFVYSHVGLWHMAVEASLAALESHSRATRNVSTVLRILDDFVKHDSTISLRSQKILLGLSKIGNARRDDNIVISEDEELSKENPALALSPEWLAEAVCLSDADIDFGCLVLEYGIVAATYSRCVYQYHDQRLIQLISDHFVALKTRFESRMEIQRPAQEIPDNKKSMASNRSSITTVKETKTALIQKDRATGQLVALPNKTVRKNRRVRTRKKKAR